MLNPNMRQLYLESLQPPVGYVLDRAITTTFSLDLLSLLMAPLSMSLFECQNKNDVLKDPIAVLEALKRTTNRLTVFCQQGRIAIPKADTLLYRHLEPVVIEVQPPSNNGVFHPKIWLLKFKNDEDELKYRFICLSKNLTFDRSWDTILIIEGYLKNRKKAFARNRPLVDFIKTLPGIATNKLNHDMLHNVNTIAEEVKRVDFQTPDGFDDFSFKPSGISDYPKPPSLHFHSRLMIMSPFLSDKSLQPLIDSGSENILISREDNLDGLKNYDDVNSNSNIYIMDESAEHPNEIEDDVNESVDTPAFNEFSGLHSKLYICENGWNVKILTGSANATIAAFSGSNVEFLVELRGKKSKIGINNFLDEEQTSFKSFLLPYKRPDSFTSKDDINKELEDILEEARNTISRSGLFLKVSKNSDETFSMCLNLNCEISINNDIITGKCYPISLKSFYYQNIDLLLNGNPIIFNNISILGLTTFIAFELMAQHENQKISKNFVLNLPIEGLPPERDKQILQNIISDKNQFIRYLLFLLAEGDLRETIIQNGDGDMSDSKRSKFQFPLFEELVRAYSRNPEKIERISKLIEDLNPEKDTDQNLLPEGFELIWEAFMIAREEDCF